MSVCLKPSATFQELNVEATTENSNSLPCVHVLRKTWELGYVHTVPDEFSTGWKFVHLGVPFTRNHAKRTKSRRVAVQKFERQNRGRIFRRYGQKFNRRAVNTLTV